MQKEIKIIDQEKKLVRITCPSERWYAKPTMNKKTGLPEFQYYPSSTWIASCWPKGVAYFKWLASVGWDESQAILHEAGGRGTRVHKAIDYIEDNGHFPVDTGILNPDTGALEFLNLEELEAVESFIRWWREVTPEKLAGEMTIFGDNYAGTLDRIYRINGRIYIVDFKTSKYIWQSMRLQVASYSHSEIDYKSLGITDEEWAGRGLALLQVGYPMNRAKYKFTDIGDDYHLFKIAYQIWAEENPDAKVKERDFPLVLQLKKEIENGRPEQVSEEKQ